SSRHSLALLPPTPTPSPLSPYTTLFRSDPPAKPVSGNDQSQRRASAGPDQRHPGDVQDRSRPHDPEPLHVRPARPAQRPGDDVRSEEHTSELQSRVDLVCRLLLEQKKET